VVTVSKSNVDSNGWSGCGYIITDPTTGAGAYMISSGESGALIFGVAGVIFLAGSLAALAFLSGAAALILSILLVFIGLLFVYMEMFTMFGSDRTNALLSCVSVPVIVHFLVERIAHYLPLVARDYIERFMHALGIQELSHCWDELNRQ